MIRGNSVFFLLFITFLVSDVSSAPLDGEEIQGGENAKLGEYTYQIALQCQNKTICGGSIIGENHVATAAHCVIDEEGEFYGFPLKVLAGTNDIKEKTDDHVVIDVEKVYVPKNYDFEIADIAILKLKNPLNLAANLNIGKVGLPKNNKKDFHGIRAVISGFGVNEVKSWIDPKTGALVEYGNVAYGKLRFAIADVLTNKQCWNYYNSPKFANPIKDSHLCAAVLQRVPGELEGVCSGDSGGPLTYNNILIGIVSSSPLGCREDTGPAIYTRVSFYLDFIDKAVNDKVDSGIRTKSLPILEL